jgi:hypothetical protein
MYTFQVKKGARLARLALGTRGRIVRSVQGDRCVVTSLATAQELAKVFAESGLLA